MSVSIPVGLSARVGVAVVSVAAVIGMAAGGHALLKAVQDTAQAPVAALQAASQAQPTAKRTAPKWVSVSDYARQ